MFANSGHLIQAKPIVRNGPHRCKSNRAMRLALSNVGGCEASTAILDKGNTISFDFLKEIL
jgi:hypothetical protein